MPTSGAAVGGATTVTGDGSLGAEAVSGSAADAEAVDAAAAAPGDAAQRAAAESGAPTGATHSGAQPSADGPDANGARLAGAAASTSAPPSAPLTAAPAHDGPHGCKACMYRTQYGHTCALMTRPKKEPPKEPTKEPPSAAPASRSGKQPARSDGGARAAKSSSPAPAPPASKSGGKRSGKSKRADNGSSRRGGGGQGDGRQQQQGNPAPVFAPAWDVTKYCGFCCQIDRSSNLLRCSRCGNSGHRACLEMSERLFARCKANPRWLCIECKKCKFCKKTGDEEKMLLCDDCDDGVHMDCIDPPLTVKPEGEFKCPTCCGAAPPAGARNGKRPLAHQSARGNGAPHVSAKTGHREGSIAGASGKRRRVDSASPAVPSADFAVSKRAVLMARFQVSSGHDKSAAQEVVEEYTSFMTLLARARDSEQAELYVAPPAVCQVWKVHSAVEADYKADCLAAGMAAPPPPQYVVAFDSPCGPTGGKILAVHAYFKAFGRWPPKRWWRYGDDAVDDIVAALNKSSKAAARSARVSSAGSRSD